MPFNFSKEENKPPNISIFNASLGSSPKDKKKSVESTPKDELDFLREINGEAEAKSSPELPSRQTMFLSDSPSLEDEIQLKSDEESKAALDCAISEGFPVKMIAVKGKPDIYEQDNEELVVDSEDEKKVSKLCRNEHISSTQPLVGGNFTTEVKEVESIKESKFEQLVDVYVNEGDDDVCSFQEGGDEGKEGDVSAVKESVLQGELIVAVSSRAPKNDSNLFSHPNLN